MLFGVSNEFAVNHERLLVRPDPSARGPVDFYRAGPLTTAVRACGPWQWLSGARPWAWPRANTTITKTWALATLSLAVTTAACAPYMRRGASRRTAAALDPLIALVEAEAKSGRAHVT